MGRGTFIIWALGSLLPLLMCCAAKTTGSVPGPLDRCADTPNCVSSTDPRKTHAVAPLDHDGDLAAARDRLLMLLSSMKGTRVVVATPHYIHAECRSLIFRFVDDLEFYLVPDGRVIHVRSAARTGYSDFGVNRRRVEEIRRLWDGAQPVDLRRHS